MKKCRIGYYYCHTEKKCKKIPLGWHVGRGGYIEQDEDSKNGKNGNGHSNGGSGNGNGGNGNGGNGNGGGMGESYSWRDELNYVQEGAAWTKKAGKNKEGGLNEKGRKSYERENPGSDLKAPQPEGGSRKKSFCARMGGMKKKLTSSKTANDPDSRINKALRKWKC